ISSRNSSRTRCPSRPATTLTTKTTKSFQAQRGGTNSWPANELCARTATHHCEEMLFFVVFGTRKGGRFRFGLPLARGGLDFAAIADLELAAGNDFLGSGEIAQDLASAAAVVDLGDQTHFGKRA